MIANLIGATGLTGSSLLHQLLDDERFTVVRAFVRRPLYVTHPKLEPHIIDFKQPDTWRHLVQGDVLFSTLGTTIREAGSQAAQYRVDFEYQYEFARAAADNGISTYILVSSVGANARSSNFYARMKGELDEAVQQLAFQRIVILRPGFLDGKRKENRTGEKIGLMVMRWIGRLSFLRPWRPIHTDIVAKAMIRGAMSTVPGKTIYTLGEVFELAGEQ